jgi:hypothetical protein
MVAGGIFPKDEVSNGPELALHRHDIENKNKHAYISYPAVQEQ